MLYSFFILNIRDKYVITELNKKNLHIIYSMMYIFVRLDVKNKY